MICKARDVYLPYLLFIFPFCGRSFQKDARAVSNSYIHAHFGIRVTEVLRQLVEGHLTNCMCLFIAVPCLSR